MKKLLYLLFFFILFISGCKKSEQSEGDLKPSLRYRLKAWVYNTNTWSFLYNQNGHCTRITTTEAGLTKDISTFQYNNKHQLILYKNQYTTDSYQYTYTANNLVATCKRFSDTAFTTLDATLTYYYDASNNLICVKTLYDSDVKDSLVFSRYVNGRPLQGMSYVTFSGYTSQSKLLYTYDSRMNRTKIERSQLNDTTSFYTDTETHFFIVDNQDLWSKTVMYSNIMIGSYQDDLNAGSRNKDTDFAIGSSYYTNCGIQKLDESEILSSNDLGFPAKVKQHYTYYNCDHEADGPYSSEYNIEYETY